MYIVVSFYMKENVVTENVNENATFSLTRVLYLLWLKLLNGWGVSIYRHDMNTFSVQMDPFVISVSYFVVIFLQNDLRGFNINGILIIGFEKFNIKLRRSRRNYYFIMDSKLQNYRTFASNWISLVQELVLVWSERSF